MDYYIYYRVRAEHGMQLLPRVQALQQDLAGRFGLAPLLRRRPEERDGLQTWMEVYAAVPAAECQQFEGALAETSARFDVMALTEGQRHLECFTEFPPCA